MKKVHVTAAVIENGHKILCVQRNSNKFEYISYKWEFPGGKVESNEQLEETIKREIWEELNLNIEVNTFLIRVEHEYPDFILTMDTFKCEIVGGELKLNEHVSFKWLERDELSQLDWAAADLPIVENLKFKA
jgi:8-oxo-dGTP diphosphatase